jgi:hypothetical protein
VLRIIAFNSVLEFLHIVVMFPTFRSYILPAFPLSKCVDCFLCITEHSDLKSSEVGRIEW